jgi:hypothetical protein
LKPNGIFVVALAAIISFFGVRQVAYGTGAINTTSTNAISAGTQTIIPVNMANIIPGTVFIVGGEADTDVGRGEWVTVASTTSNSFTATYAHAHETGAKVTNDPRWCCSGFAWMWGT